MCKAWGKSEILPMTLKKFNSTYTPPSFYIGMIKYPIKPKSLIVLNEFWLHKEGFIEVGKKVKESHPKTPLVEFNYTTLNVWDTNLNTEPSTITNSSYL